METKEEEGLIIKSALECFVEILDTYASGKDTMSKDEFSDSVVDLLEKYGFVGGDADEGDRDSE